jgi:hypothetical protein
MASKLPHTIEQLQKYVKNQADKDDTDRQEVIVEFIKRFELAKTLKQRLRTRYTECKDIFDDRKFVIDQFLYDEYRKNSAIVETLWGCVNQIQAQKSNKIRWSFEENVEAGSLEQQQQQVVQGASTSSDAPGSQQQQHQPHLD